jgi:hypothetical protein
VSLASTFLRISSRICERDVSLGVVVMCASPAEVLVGTVGTIVRVDGPRITADAAGEAHRFA